MVRRTTVDGVAAVVKDTSYDATTEAAGLVALAAAGAHVPRVLSVAAHRPTPWLADLPAATARRLRTAIDDRQVTDRLDQLRW